MQYGNAQVIQGPPGTGKSTVICYYLAARREPNRTALVVAAGNKAVDALMAKLVGFGLDRALRPVVLGRPTPRMGPTAVEYTLERQVIRRS